MPGAHRDSDSRACGASTVSRQSKNVFVNGKLWSIDGDPNSHGGGSLKAKTNKVFIGGIMVVNKGDQASPDKLCDPPSPHCNPVATGASGNVFVGD